MKQLFYRIMATVLTTILSTTVIACADTTQIPKNQTARAAGFLKSNMYREALKAAIAAPPTGPRNLLAGKAALDLKLFNEAIDYLDDAEKGYPLLADVAASLKAEALFDAKRYREAAIKAVDASRRTAIPATRRRMEKLYADALFYSGDIKEALAAYRQFTTDYRQGGDYTDSLYNSAVCHEKLGDLKSAIQTYRTIYIQHPAARVAENSFSSLKALNKKGYTQSINFTAEELLRRGELLLASNLPSSAAWVFSGIPRNGLSDELLARIELKSGLSAIRQRHYSLAKPFLKRSAAYSRTSVRDEARLLLAYTEMRLDEPEQSLAHLLSLASEKGPLADDALMEAALLNKNRNRFVESAILLERLVKEFPSSDLASRAGWELAWCNYRSGDLSAAEESMKRLFNDNKYRERSQYWYARVLERKNRTNEALKVYKQMEQEYPFGFYTAWHRLRSGSSTGHPPLPERLPEPALPAGSERVQALAMLGMLEEARTELAVIIHKVPEREQAPGLARLQNLAGDLHGSIITFQKNRPNSIEKNNLAFWAIGFPRPFEELFSRYSSTYRLSDSMVLSLAKAESSFRADVKSHAGAIGLMQLMPATARMTAGYKGKKPFNPMILTDPETNIRIGTKHLRELLDKYHQDRVYTLAAYNAGGGAVKRWRNSFGEIPRDEFIENIPYRETRNYVKKIISYIGVYRTLYRIQ